MLIALSRFAPRQRFVPIRDQASASPLRMALTMPELDALAAIVVRAGDSDKALLQPLMR